MTSVRSLYLDHAATTPVDPAVAHVMLQVLCDEQAFANPASEHDPGFAAASRLEAARAEVAAVLGARAREIVWTSGATEADNLAVLGIARGSGWRGRHVVTARTEHKAVLEPCRALEREGFEVTRLEPAPDGAVAPQALGEALREDTVLVSLMHVNNETGAIQDIAAYGAICRAAGVPLHVDAAQSAGKLPLDVGKLPVDLLSLTAHKLHGPKGAGALYVAEAARPRLAPLLFGGGQERGARPGTPALHQAVGLAAALTRADDVREREWTRLVDLRERLWAGLVRLGGVTRNSPEAGSPWILNAAFAGVEGESLRAALRGLAVSGGSACNSTRGEVSYVLKALGLSDVLAHASLRFSFGRTTSTQDIDEALALLAREVPRLRGLAPSELRTKGLRADAPLR